LELLALGGLGVEGTFFPQLARYFGRAKMTYDNTNHGTLFKNNRAEKDTDADYRGSINVGGAEYWLNAWLNTSKAGEKYLSLSVRPKAVAKPERTYATRRDDLGEDPMDFLK
jgi:hypothetical protein